MTEPKRKTKLVHVTTVPITLRFFSGQVNYLKQRGFEISMISSPGKLANQFAQTEDVVFYPVPIVRQIRLLADIISLRRLWRCFREIRPDIVHSHTPKAGLLGTLAARLAGVHVIFLSVFGLPQMTRSGFLRWLLNKTTWLACRLADRVWCDSRSMRDYLNDSKLCTQRKAMVLGCGSVNGVDATTEFYPQLFSSEKRHSLKKQYGIPDQSRVIGFVGRITIDKGMSELAHSWRVLRQRYFDLHLLLVGPFEKEDQLKKEDVAMFRSDPRVHLTGYQKEVAHFFAIMDLFVMPSYREGFGLTNIEAAAMQLPVVSTRIPGCIDSVKDGITGTLVPARDAVSLTKAIELYLNNPSLARRHGEEGRQRVLREFRPEVIWDALFQEYTTLLKEKTSQ